MTAIGVRRSLVLPDPDATTDRLVDAGKFLFPGRSRAAVLGDKFRCSALGQKLRLLYATFRFRHPLTMSFRQFLRLDLLCSSFAPFYTYIVSNTVFEVHGILLQ